MKKNILKKIGVLIVAMVVFMLSLVGCAETDTDSDLQGSRFDSNISMVQKGHPELIPNITYKEAYDYFFANPKWRGFTADDGSDVVEFSGECTYYDEDAEVYIQFVIDDEESFSMYHASLTVDGEKFTVDDQTFIELIYVPFETYSQDVLGEDLDQEVQDAFVEIYNSLSMNTGQDTNVGDNEIKVSGDLYSDVENGLLYSNKDGKVTDKKGNVLQEYRHLTILENGAITDGECILEALFAEEGGKIILGIPGGEDDTNTETSSIEGLVPKNGTYKNVNSPFYFMISEGIYGNNYTEAFIYVTVYCGREGDEYRQEYTGMINLYNPGTMLIQTGVQSAAYIDYDADTGMLSGYGLQSLVNDYTEKHKYYYWNTYDDDYYEDNETKEYFLAQIGVG